METFTKFEQERIEALQKLQSRDVEISYLDEFRTTHEISEIPYINEDSITISGRVKSRRITGKRAMFIEIERLGDSIEVYIPYKNDKIVLGTQIGSYIGVQGTLYTTATGKFALRMHEATFLKSPYEDFILKTLESKNFYWKDRDIIFGNINEEELKNKLNSIITKK